MEQIGFSRLWDGYATDKEALAARNKMAKEIRKAGHAVSCWTLPNQMKQYDGLEQFNGESCNVYMISVY